MCSQGPLRESSPKAPIPGRQRASASSCTPWRAMPRPAAASAGCSRPISCASFPTASISRRLVRIATQTAEETEALGRQLASVRPDSGALASLYLTGELGAGKTTFARGFLAALGVAAAVRSPTYTLLEIHELPGLTALHIDLYRLRDASELEPLGLREWARPGILWLIEWPERGGGRLPPADLTLTFTVGGEAHEIEVRPGSNLGKTWLARLKPVGGGGARVHA